MDSVRRGFRPQAAWLRERRKGERGTRKASHNMIWNIYMEKAKTEKKKKRLNFFYSIFFFPFLLVF